MSGLAFKYFPAANWRPAGVNIEFDSSQANTAVQNLRALLIGQIFATGTAPPNVPVQGYSQAQVNGLCGANSMLALKYAAYRLQDPFGEVWLGPLLDPVGGGGLPGTITFAGTATAAGSVPLYLMGVPVPVGVNVGDTAVIVAGNVLKTLQGTLLQQGPPPVPITPSAAGAVVTVTPAHAGMAAADIDIRFAYVGPQNGEMMPPGITAVVTGSGSTVPNPSVSNLLANCGLRAFDFIDNPYTDTANQNALQAFLGDQAGRWSAENMLYGHVFSAYGGTFAARNTQGLTRNDQHCSTLGYPNGPTGSPTPVWLEASDWCAAHVVRIRVNPAQGVSEQALNLLAPPAAVVDTPGERNTLLFSGMSTFVVDPSNTCRIDRSITTYQLNASGQPDNSYLNTNLLFQAMYAARYINSQLTTQFIAAGKILVANGTPIGPGSPAVTPNGILGSVFAIYAYLCSIFIVQQPQTFAANAYAALGTKGQVLLYLPLNFSDQVINIAILAQFQQST